MIEALWSELQHYSRNKFYGELDALDSKRKKDRSAVSEDQLARGFGLIQDPLDTRFDAIEVEHFKALLRTRLDAWFEAYEVKGLTPDDRIWKELGSFKQQSIDARKMSLRQTATGIANRTGRNSAPGIACADARGQELERSAHAFMKILRCEVEKRKNMKPNTPDGAQIVNNLTIHGDATNIAMGQLATIHVSEYNVFNSIEAAVESKLQDCREKSELLDTLATLRHAKGKPSFLEKVNKLIGIANGCATLAPHISQWTQELHKYAQAVFGS